MYEYREDVTYFFEKESKLVELKSVIKGIYIIQGGFIDEAEKGKMKLEMDSKKINIQGFQIILFSYI